MEESLKRALKQNRMTQYELAEKLFVTPQAVSRWINGESRPSFDNASKISELLGVDLLRHEKNKKEANKDILLHSINDLDTFEKAENEAKNILNRLGYDSKYSHAVNMLCYWLLSAIIGLVYHKYLHNRDKEIVYDYEDIYFCLAHYINDELIDANKCGLYTNELEYDFYIMGMDLSESFGEYRLINHEYAREALHIWYTFKTSLVKDNSSPVYNELLVAISEIMVNFYKL